MPETATAAAPTAVESSATTTTPVNVSNTIRYQISEDALKSLRSSRHSRRHTGVTRNHSGGSKPSSREQSPTQLDTSRYSNRSSTSSLWSNVVGCGRGRRIYGSAVSVASSITLTEFGGDNISEEFEISEASLDIRQFANDANDSKPNLPQRQTSVTAGQSSSGLLSQAMMMSQHGSRSDHTGTSRGANKSNSSRGGAGAGAGAGDAAGCGAECLAPPPIEYKRSSDLSPKQPGRKTSLANSTEHDAIAASIATQSTTKPATNHHNHNNHHNRTRSFDSIPQYPSRKKSSKVMEGEDLLGGGEQRQLDLTEQALLFQEQLPIASLTYEGKTYENAFNAAEAIDHMIEIGLVVNRQDGVELGLTLAKELELFHHVAAAPSKDNKPFCDDEQEIYQLAMPCKTGPLPSCMLSVMRRKTDTSISIEEESPLEERTAKHLSIPHTTTATATAATTTATTKTTTRT